ncbi:MAG: threonine/serine dehydratase [Pseudomonadota bacterium]
MDWPTEIDWAHDRIRHCVRQTPVMQVDLGFDQPVALKLEHVQHTGSFKSRGAFNTLLSEPVPAAGLVAASGGNHGAAVAYAAGTLGHAAQIFVPDIAGPAKIALIERQGAVLNVVQGSYAQALEAALDYAARTGALQIHAYDAPATVAGQGTCMAEWEDQGLEADTVLIAVGGGGLIAGALGWFDGRRRVIAVEPERCPTLRAAQTAGTPVEVEVGGVAANALGARRIGGICFDLASQHDTRTVLVSEDAITEAQHWLWHTFRLLVEPAAAAAMGALRAGVYVPGPGERVAVLLCGGNVDPDPLARPV